MNPKGTLKIKNTQKKRDLLHNKVRVSHFALMSKINWAQCVFSLVRSLGPPKKNLGSFRAFFTVAQEIEYFQFSKGGPW